MTTKRNYKKELDDRIHEILSRRVGLTTSIEKLEEMVMKMLREETELYVEITPGDDKDDQGRSVGVLVDCGIKLKVKEDPKL